MKVAFDFLCLDEHDSPNLAEFSAKSRDKIAHTPNRRHFGICGVVIPGAIYPNVNIEGRRIQFKNHPDKSYTPFHYVEILNKKDKYSYLGKDTRKFDSLTDLLDGFVSRTKFKIIACFIDKQKLAMDYGIFRNDQLEQVRRIKPNMHKPAGPREINLYEISLKYILIEYHKYLVAKKKRGLIIAEARGEHEDHKLLDAFHAYQRMGVGNLSGKAIQQYIVDLLIIRKSQNHLGLQIADLITYPLYDYYVPNHNTRKDHFISYDSFKKKILAVKIFP